MTLRRLFYGIFLCAAPAIINTGASFSKLKSLSGYLPGTTKELIEMDDLGIKLIKKIHDQKTLIDLLPIIGGCASLQSINLDHQGLVPKDLDLFDHLPESLQLDELSVKDNNVGSHGSQHLMEIAQRHQITHLNLWNTGLEPRNIEIISQMLPNSPIRHLNLGANPLTQESARSLAQAFSGSPKLESLNLAENLFDQNVFEIIIRALPSSNLAYLNLASNEINASRIELLTIILPQTKIKSLVLDYNPLGSKGMEKLAAQLPKTHIEVLSLADTKPESMGLLALTRKLNESKITELILRENTFGHGSSSLYRDDAIIFLNKTLECADHKIKTLDISSVPMGIGACNHLKQICRFQKIDLTITTPELGYSRG